MGVKLKADLKALVHLVVDDMSVDFNLATGAQNPVVFSAGDLTQTRSLPVCVSEASTTLGCPKPEGAPTWLRLPHEAVGVGREQGQS